MAEWVADWVATPFHVRGGAEFVTQKSKLKIQNSDMVGEIV